MLTVKKINSSTNEKFAATKHHKVPLSTENYTTKKKVSISISLNKSCLCDLATNLRGGWQLERNQAAFFKDFRRKKRMESNDAVRGENILEQISKPFFLRSSKIAGFSPLHAEQ